MRVVGGATVVPVISGVQSVGTHDCWEESRKDLASASEDYCCLLEEVTRGERGKSGGGGLYGGREEEGEKEDAGKSD